MDKFANDGPLTFTLREMQGLIRSARFWAVIASIVAILGLAGPFDSFSTMSLAERTFYWALVVVGSFAAGLFVSMWTTVSTEGAGLAPPLALLMGSLAAALPIAAYNGLVQMVFFGTGFPAEFVEVLPYALVISVIVAFTYRYARDDEPEPPAIAPGGTGVAVPSAVFEKLPQRIGRDVVSVQAQDHYVKVTTPLGSALVLMKLSHAERDLAALDGLRVHRSWWVRKCHVRRLVRTDGKLTVETSDGASIPVGRKYREQVLSLFETA
ncbi:MAG: LytTR family transcriptional regulator [Phyllobacteriaceae bacterium]|nr:LytTR family transcriptional regulator [Phyllobacteriaceae bacterium]